MCVAPFTAVNAAETPPPEKSATMRFLEQDYLLGDWGGFRTDLSKRGVDFEFVWFGALANNVSGGIDVGSEWEGAMLMMMSLNSDKLVGYHGGTLAASSLYIHNTREFSRFGGAMRGDRTGMVPDLFPAAAPCRRRVTGV